MGFLSCSNVLMLIKNICLESFSSNPSKQKKFEEFINWILNIGDDKVGEANDGKVEIEILTTKKATFSSNSHMPLEVVTQTISKIAARTTLVVVYGNHWCITST